MVLQLLSYSSSYCCYIFFIQRTPLYIAAREGYRYTVEHLVEEGADISIRDNMNVSV